MLSVWETQMERPELCQPRFQSRAPRFGDVSGCFGGSRGSDASGGNTLKNPSPEPCSLQLQTPDFVPQPPKTHPRCLCSPHPTGHPPEGCSARPWCGAWGSAMRSFGDAPMLCSAACSSVPRQRLTKSPRRCLALILCSPLLPFRTANPWLLPPQLRGRQPPRAEEAVGNADNFHGPASGWARC